MNVATKIKVTTVQHKAMNRFQITCPDQLPGAIFFSRQDALDGVHRALAEEQAIADFRKDRAEPALWESLLALGWDYAEIDDIIANPKAVRRCAYGWPAEYAQVA